MRTVCFSGIDGCGKSTQSRILAERLRASGAEVELIHILTEGKTVASNLQRKPLLRVFHKRLKDLPSRGFLGSIKLIIGLISFFLDAWLSVMQYRIRYGGKIVIYDRFFYDHLVIFATTFPKTPWWVINIAKILPRSDIAIVMHVPPEVGNIRKPEESVAKLTTYSKFYYLLASILGVEVINGAQDVKTVAKCVYRKCAKLNKQ